MRLGVIAAIAFGLAGISVLTALGVWQIHRLEWKEALIATLEARLAAPAVMVPADPDPIRDSFLRVQAEGRLGGTEAHVLTSLKPLGPGFRVIAPMTLTDGRRVLVDLGFVPEAQKNARRAPAEGVVIGALYWPDETDGFTPAPDLGANIWFARDLGAMARALDTLPLMIVAESHPMGESPTALRLGVSIPNDHLQYALTWFSLALIWAVMSAMLVRRERLRLGR